VLYAPKLAALDNGYYLPANGIHGSGVRAGFGGAVWQWFGVQDARCRVNAIVMGHAVAHESSLVGRRHFTSSARWLTSCALAHLALAQEPTQLYLRAAAAAQRSLSGIKLAHPLPPRRWRSCGGRRVKAEVRDTIGSQQTGFRASRHYTRGLQSW
jgi:hypothetical protein